MLARYFRRFPHAIRGLTYAAKHDFGYRTQLYGIGLVLIIITWWLSPLSSFEVLFTILAYSLILITELQNSALEIALDQLHPQLNETIGVSKDMTAGAVLIAGIFLVGVIVVLVYSRFSVIIGT